MSSWSKGTWLTDFLIWFNIIICVGLVTLNFFLLQTHPPLTWSERSRILKDVCRGLTWLHGSKRIHGDIKAYVYTVNICTFYSHVCSDLIYALCRANVLLDRHLTAKIGDFGFSRELPELVEGRTMISAVVVAKSLGYSPPEVDSSHISTKSDVYSYGNVSYMYNSCVSTIIHGESAGCTGDLYRTSSLFQR